MKRLRTPLLVSLAAAVLLILAFFVIGSSQKAQYDQMRDKLANELGGGLSAVPLDQAMLDEVTQWSVLSSETADASAHTQSLKTLGKEPTVENLVDLLSGGMPPYAWFDLPRNRRNLETGAVLATITPVSVDGSIHVSADGGTAIILHSDGVASVFTDTEDGLRDEIRSRDQPGTP